MPKKELKPKGAGIPKPVPKPLEAEELLDSFFKFRPVPGGGR